MTRLLAVYRVTALIVGTLFLLAGLIVSRAVASFGDRAEDYPGQPSLADHSVRRWARMTQRLCGMRIRVDGDLPSGPVAFVANHLSYIDIVALWCVVPGAFVARADVADWPLVGWAGKKIGTIFIDRTRKRDLLRVLPEMQAALADGRNVIFFPEGTSSRGEEVLPFKSSLFEAAVRENVPVVAVSVQFETTPPAPSADWSVGWWADMTFGSHVFDLLHLPGFEARLRFSSLIEIDPTPYEQPSPSLPNRKRRSGWKRKELCQLSQEAVEKRFIPTTPSTVERTETRSPSTIDGTGPIRLSRPENTR